MPEPRAAVPRLGPLEQEVMDILWDCPDELCTREVLQHLTSHTLAYTTVATVLTNLVKKVMVERISVDRTWAYRPLQSRSQYAAGIMSEALTASQDRAAAFLHFVQNMSDHDSALLRGLLAAPTDVDLADSTSPRNPPAS
ncbi:BlaI/MecI/CopY family transcriptional regulator [Pengzhenrongella phosphoraccumulans]|uniref:BlaI/MecI/CopY family transcriptional regulator n=1 Tax=Pengzhenrongella phosphoraccumulans TaxID=3114394 RepID=UPI00389098E0